MPLSRLQIGADRGWIGRYCGVHWCTDAQAHSSPPHAVSSPVNAPSLPAATGTSSQPQELPGACVAALPALVRLKQFSPVTAACLSCRPIQSALRHVVLQRCRTPTPSAADYEAAAALKVRRRLAHSCRAQVRASAARLSCWRGAG